MTQIYGTSYDLIEIQSDEEGQLDGEVGYYARDEKDGALVILSDGTVLTVFYGKVSKAIWEIKLVERGELFERIDICTDPDADRYSDTAVFKSGLKWAYVAKTWQRVE